MGTQTVGDAVVDFAARDAAIPVRVSTWVLPIRTRSAPNLREHWAVRARRTRDERAVVAFLMANVRLVVGTPHAVLMTRLGPRRMDDDNATAGCKAVRDEIANLLGIDDGDKRVTWDVQQEKAKDYALRVEVVHA